MGPVKWKIEVLTGGHILGQVHSSTLKIGKRFPGKRSNGTFSASKSASIKLRAVAMSGVSTNCNVSCCYCYSARLWAVRRVTQDNRGKRTPGVDGLASLTPSERLALAHQRRYLDKVPDPVRRTYIDKPGTTEKRPLGIPTVSDRAYQALVKLALEPEWEAKFEPNSYGFRPGRWAHDAIEAIYNHIRLKPK